MKRTIFGRYASAAAFTCLSLLAAANHLNAQGQGPDCGKLLVNQSYAYVFQGFLNVPEYFAANHMGEPPAGVGIVPNAGGGIITFLPGGKVSGRLTLSVGLMGLYQGLLVDPEKSTYTLSLDTTRTPSACTGVMDLVAGAITDHFQLVASQDGQRIQMVSTFSGLTLNMTGVPVDASGCTNRTIEGAYLVNLRGWGLSGGPFTFPAIQLLSGYFPFAFSGELAFHSVPFPRSNDPGTVEAWDMLSMNGTILPRSESGSYTLKPDCTGMLTLADSTGMSFHLEMIVDRKSGDIYVVNVDTAPGATVPAFLLAATMTRDTKQ